MCSALPRLSTADPVLDLPYLQSYPAVDETVPVLRRDLKQALVKAGFDDDAVDVAVLLVSEVATNAVRHGSTDEGMRITAGAVIVGDVLRIDVTDRGSADVLPTPTPAALDDTGGRGLMLVETLASGWGCVAHADYKAVWFTVPINT